MTKYREIYNKVLPEDKRKEEKFNLLASMFLRPLSILMTIPLIKTNIKPTTITKISIISVSVGFFFLAFGLNTNLRFIGWIFIFFWVLLDGVDGNLARCTNKCSTLGDLWDTMGGYTAMVLIYFGTGIAAFYDKNLIGLIDNYWYLIIGGATSVFSIFPRLIMHKKKSLVLNSTAVKALSDKKSYGVLNIIALNFVSPTGVMQVFLILSIFFHMLNIFILAYSFITLLVMIISLYKLFAE